MDLEQDELLMPAAPQFSTPEDTSVIVDELDPTLAPAYPNPDDLESDELFDGADLSQEEQEWTIADGILDFSGTVRIWTDGTGLLQNAQLSRYWRERTRQMPLELMFEDAFTQMKVAFGAGALPIAGPSQVDDEVSLDANFLSGLRQRSAELSARLAEMDDDEGISRWEGKEASARDSRGKVQLTVNMYGFPTAVQFDRRWLDDVSGAQVCRSVLEAYQRARANWHEPVFVPGERYQIAGELATISKQIEVAIRNGPSYLRMQPFTRFNTPGAMR